MAFEITVSKAEFDEQIEQAEESTMSGESKWPGMSYEEGVSAALRWVVGESHDPPMAE